MTLIDKSPRLVSVSDIDRPADCFTLCLSRHLQGSNGAFSHRAPLRYPSTYRNTNRSLSQYFRLFDVPHSMAPLPCKSIGDAPSRWVSSFSRPLATLGPAADNMAIARARSSTSLAASPAWSHRAAISFRHCGSHERRDNALTLTPTPFMQSGNASLQTRSRPNMQCLLHW
jgi:hypothetical protein